MNGLFGIKLSFSGNLNNRNNIAAQNELNNFSLLKKPTADVISFESRSYTKSQKKIMHAIRDIAVKLGLPDFYTGKKFSKAYLPTVEHLLPFSQGKRAAESGLQTVNSLANFVPAGEAVNGERSSIPLKKWFAMHPDFLQNAKNALKEYEKVNTPEINGKNWVADVKKLLNKEMGAITFTGRKSPQYQNLSYMA